MRGPGSLITPAATHGVFMLALLLACSTPAPPPVPEAPPPPADPWAGSMSCAPCHAEQHAAWVGSHHALAERPAAAVQGVWKDRAPLTGGGDTAFVRVIGVDPLWQPLVDMGGRTQVSSRAWDTTKGEWFDIFDDARQPGEWGHWTGRGMTWDRQCAACHVTAPAVSSSRDERYATTWRELGVACEACHGPSAAHAQTPSLPTPGPRDRDVMEDTCAGCHVRGQLLTDHLPAGGALLDHAAPALPGLDENFGPDGTVVAEDFEWAAFRLSRMHAGGVRCQDCHDGHTGALRTPGDGLCLSCHAGRPGWQEHAHHAPGTPGGACVDCHMPITTYMQRDPRHDHRFASPDPALSRELGQRSACDRCHTVDDALLRKAEGWWTYDPRVQDRTRAIDAARDSRPDAADRVAAALATETDPAWRAVLLGVTAAWPARFEADQLRALADPDPLVRMAALDALGPSPAPRPSVEPLLRDPLAAVRHAAARVLEPQVPPTDPRLVEHRAWLEAHADLPSYAAELAAWWSAAGRNDEALSLLERAARLDPRNPDWLRNLAVARSASGDAQAALDALDRALALRPDDADLHFLRALGLRQIGRNADATAALRQATTLAPDHARAQFNLGVLELEAGDRRSAAKRLERATTLDPTRSDAPFALAIAREQLGDRAGAAAALEIVLQRDPGHPDAQAMLQALRQPERP